MNRTIDITSAQRKTLLALLEQHLPQTTAWVYGSRVQWTARPQSDLDMVVFASPSQNSQVSALREAFEDSNLPFRVDLFVWDDVPDQFRKQIEADHAVLVSKKESKWTGSKWSEATIEEISEKVAMGPFGSSIKVAMFVAEGVPIISGQHLHGLKIDDSPGFNFISSEHAQRLSNSNVKHGDVIFTHAGNIGQVAYIPSDSKFNRYVISQRQFYMRCDRSKAIPQFVTLYFKSPEGQHKLLANTVQVGVPSIAQPVSYLRTIEIPLPPITEQRAIAHILGTLDDKIELNRRMNETLEAMAQALFKSWFVDFDPVHAKATLPPPQPSPACSLSATPPQRGSEWTPERARAYLDSMDDDIIALFPDSFEDSELGKIPKGWKVKPIEDIAEVSTGKRPGAKYSETSPIAKVPLWGGNGPMAFVPEPLIEYPILLTGRVGTLGSVFRITSPCWPSDNTLIFKAKDKRVFELLFFQLKRIDFAFLNRGSTQPLVTQTNLKEQIVLLPSEKILERFHTLTKVLYARLDESETESRTLSALLDTLLPKLVSGEIRIHEFEKLIEAKI